MTKAQRSDAGEYQLTLENKFGKAQLTIKVIVLGKKKTLIKLLKDLVSCKCRAKCTKYSFKPQTTISWCLLPIHFIQKMGKNCQGATGVEPVTSRSAVECSATELYPHNWYINYWLKNVNIWYKSPDDMLCLWYWINHLTIDKYMSLKHFFASMSQVHKLYNLWGM